MARIFDGLAVAQMHAAEFDCEPDATWVPLSSATTCPVRFTDECLENHTHARQCDDCGADMILTRASCEHVRVSTHRCPNDGFTKQYAGRAA
jgi:predicted RNA-binding Zn-ribbon protein involved in translation (DUF1610 family)